MKRFSNIEESVWNDIRKRGNGSDAKKEDTIKTNIKDISPVDIGVSVLWADKDLSIDDEIYLYINQVKDFEKDGWRLPTKNEADELLTKVKWTTTKNSQGGFNRFYKIGMTHIPNAPEENIIYFNCEIPKEAEYWESESVKNTSDGYWETFSFKNDGSFLPHSAHSISKITDKCRVRLVKDK